MASVRAQTLITVDDVAASRRWYEVVLGVTSRHGGDEYDQLGSPDEDDFLLQLHDWEADEHPHLGDRDGARRGDGVVLWFRVDDVDGAFARIAEGDVEVLEGPQLNPNAQHREIWVRDPDGYTVVVAGRYGDVGAEG
jgi:catechol 2,3-dioxygenase-like lactoylglutathione lyase family enzyme